MLFNIIRDTQEKKNFWTFANYNVVNEVIDKKLKTGDYTIEGMEDILCIERKHGIGELAKNIVEARFERELIRMGDFKYSYLILEFGLEDVFGYPFVNSVHHMAKKKAKIRGPFILKKLAEISVKYNIQMIPCGHPKYAEEMVISLMKRIYEQEF
jgi:ERCC4-type nuclease